MYFFTIYSLFDKLSIFSFIKYILSSRDSKFRATLWAAQYQVFQALYFGVFRLHLAVQFLYWIFVPEDFTKYATKRIIFHNILRTIKQPPSPCGENGCTICGFATLQPRIHRASPHQLSRGISDRHLHRGNNHSEPRQYIQHTGRHRQYLPDLEL